MLFSRAIYIIIIIATPSTLQHPHRPQFSGRMILLQCHGRCRVYKYDTHLLYGIIKNDIFYLQCSRTNDRAWFATRNSDNLSLYKVGATVCIAIVTIAEIGGGFEHANDRVYCPGPNLGSAVIDNKSEITKKKNIIVPGEIWGFDSPPNTFFFTLPVDFSFNKTDGDQ